MNDILKEVESLKDLIILSDENKNYDKYLKKIKNNKTINLLINKIKKTQKDLLKNEIKNIDNTLLEKQIDEYYNELYLEEDYIKYIHASKELNDLLTILKMNFENYFNSLIE